MKYLSIRPLLTIIYFENLSLWRDRRFWSVPLVTVTLSYLIHNATESPAAKRALGSDLVFASFQPAAFIVVLVAGILLGVRSITQKRESNSSRFLASFPLTRTELLLGIYFGRSVAVFGTVLFSLVPFILGSAYVEGVPSIVAMILFVFSLFLYSLACVSIGVVSSTIFKRSGGALSSGAILFILFTSWEKIIIKAYNAITVGNVSYADPPHAPFLYLIIRLAPTNAFYVFSNGILNAPNQTATAYFGFSAAGPNTLGNVFIIGQIFHSNIPFYLQPWFGGVILIMWSGVLLTISLCVFTRGDLQ